MRTSVALAWVLASGCGATPPPCALPADCPAPLACDRGRCEDPTVSPSADVLASRRLRVFAVEDCLVVSGDGEGQTRGPTDFLLVGAAGTGTSWRTYLRFDLSSLGPAPRVSRADLVLASRDDPPGLPTGDVLVGVHRAAHPWSAASITWRSQPGRDGPERSVARIPTARRVRVRFDVTSLVRDWTRGVHENFGLVLSARDEGADSRVVFYSSRTSDVEARPRLDVWLHGSAPGGSPDER